MICQCHHWNGSMWMTVYTLNVFIFTQLSSTIIMMKVLFSFSRHRTRSGLLCKSAVLLVFFVVFVCLHQQSSISSFSYTIRILRDFEDACFSRWYRGLQLQRCGVQKGTMVFVTDHSMRVHAFFYKKVSYSSSTRDFL